MVYTIPYTTNFHDKFEDYVPNRFGAELNFNEDCFIYFHYGSNASKYLDEDYPDYFTSFDFVSDLEKRFNVNINWIDLSFIFDHFLISKPEKEDLLALLFNYRRLYTHSIEKMLKEGLLFKK